MQKGKAIRLADKSFYTSLKNLIFVFFEYEISKISNFMNFIFRKLFQRFYSPVN